MLVELKTIRKFLDRELVHAERAAGMVRAQRLAMAAAIAGIRAELAMLKDGGPRDLAEITQRRLDDMVAQLATFDREVAIPAEARLYTAELRADRFEAFVQRVITP